ncbi:hypothetical protein CROQUDRAFT_44743 [Cronartium quercuum f. sp. fusiforme G11]|uniref:SET domain-containing protein n=1 Tax=Cronartium quercuum f. sp. fusiforme G11 TaxID=708437 RepID=A0A9P6TBF7_9BASI|nr:hypothetical protein CROQUDRAFT_44743 [Cronartium quercuum f. sp. fusiforme G11]
MRLDAFRTRASILITLGPIQSFHCANQNSSLLSFSPYKHSAANQCTPHNSLILVTSQPICLASDIIPNHSSKAEWDPSPLDSTGLVYKFDQVTYQPLLSPIEDGFVNQGCYPHENDVNDESFCIFLNSAFANGRGLVFLSRPSVFKRAIATLTDPGSVMDETQLTRPIEVVKMPLKSGKGVRAKDKIHLGDQVITDYAIVAISVEKIVWDRTDWPEIRKKMIDCLPLRTRAAFAALHGTGESEEAWIGSAIQRNGFEFSVGEEEVPFFAVVPDPSRLNHDCRPNAVFYFEEDKLRVIMNAVREISPGEEVTIAYRDVKMSRTNRHLELSHYGFECTCSLCSLPDHAVAVSDSRIRMIDELTTALSDWTKDSIATPIMAEYVLELFKIERLDSDLDDAYTMLSLAHNAVGETGKARMYASMALARGIILHGPGWQELEDVLELEQSPETHWSYGIRKLKV